MIRYDKKQTTMILQGTLPLYTMMEYSPLKFFLHYAPPNPDPSVRANQVRLTLLTT